MYGVSFTFFYEQAFMIQLQQLFQLLLTRVMDDQNKALKHFLKFLLYIFNKDKC